MIAGLLCAVAASLTVATKSAANDARPNVIVITTDDMRLDDLRYMPHTRQLLGQLNLRQFISNHPLCCPARAQLLTGQFAQNSGVFHNGGPFGAYHTLADKDNTLPAWLHDAGYGTALVGKFINGWRGRTNGSVVPRGWDAFEAFVGLDYHAFNYGIYTGPDTDPEQPGIYTNDFVTQRSIDQIKRMAGEKPFFMWSSYVAPHGMTDDTGKKWIGAVPAPRHDGLYDGVIPPHESKPSFKPYAGSRARWRSRVESLLSVDEGVRDIVGALGAAGELDNTVVVFTSDNGFMLGEHGLHAKNVAWEESLRVPLLARGPGVGVGASSKGAMFVDLAPSIAALAGVAPGRVVDGRSDLFATGGGWVNTLIQAGHDNLINHFSWRGTRTPRWTYVHWLGGRKQLFDRAKDPYQIRNLAGKRPKVERRLARLTPNPY